MNSSALVSPSPADRPRRRPRNRKVLILRAAGELFLRDGYHATSLWDVADAVGITSTAIYRHFRSKEDLLARTLFAHLEQIETRLAGLDGVRSDPDAVLRELAGLALEMRGVPALWQREARNLARPVRRELLHRVGRLAGTLAGIARAWRPELDPADADFLGWCALSVLGSPSYHAVRMPRPEFEWLLRRLIHAAFAAPLHPAGDGTAPRPHRRLDLGSRRERVLAAATRLFHERGYTAVGIEEIAEAAGITGPTIYHHFTGKAEILAAVLGRGVEWMRLYTSRAFAEGRTPREVLDLLLTSYVDVTLDHPDLIGILVSEVIHLPPEEARKYRRIQRDGIDEWVRLLREDRPPAERAAWSPAAARVVAQAVIMMVNDLTRLPPMRRRAHLAADIVSVGRAVLFVR
ncbi:TetR/AcrR family transcriptional regulator [Amycolatopsis arida]|uniref:TetR/AcrR family transcriptional regulator n=1 Tax=Amycolatopsis arida TaxID=587909 RepID=UPI001417063B|nr:TetR family transcriptional regulator [Amycolatopsis arida]